MGLVLVAGSAAGAGGPKCCGGESRLRLSRALRERVILPQQRAAAAAGVHADSAAIEQIGESLLDVLRVGVLQIIDADDFLSASR